MQIQSDFRFSGDGVIPEVLNMLKSIKGVDTMQCLKELEALERMPWHKKLDLEERLKAKVQKKAKARKQVEDAVQKVQDTDDLRLKAITLLQKKGGSSYLGIVSAALGLKSLDTTFGQKALAARVAVLLKVEHWGHVAKGPAAPPEMAGKRRPWCYVDPSGNAVKDRASAQQVMTHSQEFYRTRLFTNVNASCWLPASKAPLQADFETDWEQISISA
eukprot:g26016.t1